MVTSRNYHDLVYQFQTKHILPLSIVIHQSVMSNQYENKWLILPHPNIIRYILYILLYHKSFLHHMLGNRFIRGAAKYVGEYNSLY